MKHPVKSLYKAEFQSYGERSQFKLGGNRKGVRKGFQKQGKLALPLVVVNEDSVSTKSKRERGRRHSNSLNGVDKATGP